ncbi:hypothetical protein [Kitasatospora sp. NPDC050463]|uniref:hypothetical protein n=1 Tax=Kitasatospora sp. NPDC050463 TaxID=3155786 RepID=UPI0033F82484
MGEDTQRTACFPLAGLILAASPIELPTVPDDFAQAVEEHLAVQGSPVLGRLPEVLVGALP